MSFWSDKIYNDTTRSKRLHKRLQQDHKTNKEFCDFIIRCEDSEFHVHKCVVGLFSDFFKTMFASDMKEKYENETKISVVSAETMRIVIEFLYDDDVKVNRENVYNLLSAADFLQISVIKEACRDYLESNFSCETVLKDWVMLRRYHTHSEKIETNVVKWRYSLVKQKSSLSVLNEENFQDFLLLTKTHFIPSVTFKCIMNWIEHDSSARTNYLDMLTEHVDFKSLSKKFLTETVSKNEIIRKSAVTMSRVLDAVCQFIVNEEPLCLPSDVKMAALFKNDDEYQVKMFNAFNKNWTELGIKYSSHEKSSLLIEKNTLYMLGGEQESNCSVSSKARYLDLNDVSSGWEDMTSMHTARRRFGSAIYKDFLYVAGGELNRNYWIDSVEYYDFTRDRWFRSTALNSRRSGHALLAYRGKLFALGGGSDICSAECVEWYEGRNWNHAPPMKKPRHDFSAVVLNDQIYTIGGDQDDLTSVERFDLRANAWYDVASMTKRNLGHVYACVANGKIYAMDDKDQSVEVYDPVVDEWKEVPPTPDDQTNDDESLLSLRLE
ncbi:kelch-like protein 26 [Clavelina lepadiformis]|uniref:kelch-like protein 26 n=1 Tax=Clavelina lepadiformis TaxID=159417 RepID=UPI0040424290